MNTDALATRLVDLEARKADLELEIKRIKAELLAAAEPGDTIDKKCIPPAGTFTSFCNDVHAFHGWW